MITEVLHADSMSTPLSLPNGTGYAEPGNAGGEAITRCRVITPQQIADVLNDNRPGDLLYLDVEAPTPEDIAFLRETFNFHALAIEDIEQSGQRTKVDDYGSFVHVVMYTVDRDREGKLSTCEVDLFYSNHYLVTVHGDPVPALQEAVHRWQRNNDLLGSGIGALIYAVLDAIVDGYFPVLDAIEDEVEQAEDRVFVMRDTTSAETTVQFLFARRKELMDLRRVIAPARDVTATLSRRTLAHLHAEIAPYMTDVNDHVIRIVDTIDNLRDLLSSAMEAATAVQSDRLNQTIRTMTASTIILMVVTLIAGIYGMNFQNMPELSWTYGYPFALSLMVAASALLYLLFRRYHWF